ncbi:MAG: type I glyceraldehyde-3-phosphate dehydrogenase [Acidobacteria bacterium]|nr:MAG: type I glyceraldehyde-3-phosphate dehydrogenase [Acidobacteriota bacterium]
MLRVGLNGAGRIGRALLRLLRDDPEVTVVAVNDRAGAAAVAHLLRHDSIHGPFPGRVEALDGDRLVVGERELAFGSAAEPCASFWRRHEVSVVIEATGRFTQGGRAREHLAGGDGLVIVTAVSGDADLTVVPGVEGGRPWIDAREGWRSLASRVRGARVVSLASCTTHAAALPLAVIDERFGIEAAEMTTVHCTTGSQPTIDGPHPDPRRSRSALLSMIPTTTSAARGLVEVLPALAGRLSCLAVRVPTATVSLVEIVAHTRGPLPDRSRIAEAFEQPAAGALAGLLGTTGEPLVSIDFRGDPHSAVVDLLLVERPGDRLLRVVAWYDNEWGYANRVADLLRVLAGSFPGAGRGGGT